MTEKNLKIIEKLKSKKVEESSSLTFKFFIEYNRNYHIHLTPVSSMLEAQSLIKEKSRLSLGS